MEAGQTVADLKTRIHQLHRDKPDTRQQQLLYCGERMDDNVVISELKANEGGLNKIFLNIKDLPPDLPRAAPA